MFNDPALMRAIQDDRYYRRRRAVAYPESPSQRPQRPRRRTSKL